MKLRIGLRRRPSAPVSESKAWAALLMAWMALTLSATNYLDSGPTRMLPPALQAVTATIGLWRPIPYAGSLFAVGGSVLYLLAGIASRFGLAVWASADLSLAHQGATHALLAAAPGLVTVFLALQGTGWLADTLANRTERDEAQRLNDRQMIEDLVPTHADTGIMKWAYAQRDIREEVNRARRYGVPLSFALLGPQDSGIEEGEEPDLEDLALKRLELANVVKAELRPTDLLALHPTGDLVVLLPHTPLQGALIALDKVQAEAGKAGLGPIAVGIAEFPEDGADAEELSTEAEHAVAFARQSELGMVSRSLLA